MSLIPAFLKNLLIIVELFDIMIEKITTGIIYFIFQKFTIFHNLVVYKPNLKLTNQNLVINLCKFSVEMVKYNEFYKMFKTNINL